MLKYLILIVALLGCAIDPDTSTVEQGVCTPINLCTQNDYDNNTCCAVGQSPYYRGVVDQQLSAMGGVTVSGAAFECRSNGPGATKCSYNRVWLFGYWKFTCDFGTQYTTNPDGTLSSFSTYSCYAA